MSNNEEKNVDVAKESWVKKNGRKLIIPIAIIIVLLLLGIGFCAKTTVSSGELSRRLKAEGSDTIEINGTVKVDEPLVINGNKKIIGKGTIILSEELAGEWDGGSGSKSWGTGCTKLDVKDIDKMAAMLNVSKGAKLTVAGSITVDADGKGNVILVTDGGKFELAKKATVKNGRYANIIIDEKASAKISGGTVADAEAHGVINKGKLDITGGELTGAKTGAVVYNLGEAEQSGGTISGSQIHNVYVAAGTFTMTGGANTAAAKDGINVQDGGKAEIKGGDISNANHGLCNSGEMEVGKITLKESGIMNYKPGKLTLNGTTVDTSTTYCLANNGGTVKAKNFTAERCDTCAIYNFSGDMELTDVHVTGSRDGNIANGGGNLVVKGGQFDKCRDKSIVVGNGKAVFEDVVLAGTSREKYGCYVYGGELYITGAEVYDISSTAFKVDTGGYIEAKDIDMRDIAQIAFRADGGKILADGVTMKNLGSHCLYNMNGDITVKNAKLDGTEKNAIQSRGGVLVVENFEGDNITNHGAYVALGKVTLIDSTLKNMGGNGIYLIEGETEAVLDGTTIDTTAKQGINNSSKVTVKDSVIKNTTQNGIFNKATGTMTVDGIEIINAGEHGINNYNKMTLKDADIKGSGKGKNCLQNSGTLTFEKVALSGSKNHGFYNTGKASGSDITVKDSKENGIYNAKGTVDIKKVEVKGAGQHGLNNAATMTVSNVTVSGTGAGKNSVQNSEKGTLTINNATLKDSKNHGIYNKGQLSGKEVEITDVAKNGVFNDTKGNLKIAGLTVKNTGEHGVNNTATAVLSNVTIDKPGAGKNCIQNSGSMEVTKATLKNSKNHAFYNTGTVVAKDITVPSAAKNGIYNYANGVMKITGLDVKDTGEHGINNDATITVSNATIAKSGEGKNNIQNSGTLTVSDSTLKDSKNHGIYNKGTANVNDIKVQGAAKNGIYNDAEGSMNINGANIKATGEHGINNAATITVANATITTPGAGKNCIQNTGVATVKNSEFSDAPNHGIYNTGKMTTEGTLTFNNIDANAIYNYEKGVVDAAKVVVKTTGGHGINNAATFSVDNLSVDSVVENGIQNSGTFTVVSKANITNSGKHGLYNGKNFVGNNITIKNAFDLSASNSGDMEIHGFDISGTAHKAFYNSGYAELYKTTIEGKDIKNTESAAYLVDNNGGILDLTDTTLLNAYGTALHTRGSGSTSVTNVVIDKAGNYGAFVEGGSMLSGDGFEINNVWKNTEEVPKSEGMPMKNGGKITMLDHVTVGTDDPDVTGSGAATSGEYGEVVSNVIQNDAAKAGYSGYDLVVRNVTGGNLIYDKGYSYITDIDCDTVNNGVVVRYGGHSTLAGNITLKNTKTIPMRIFDETDKITIASGSNVEIDTAGGHAINNLGSFLAAADTNITIKNIKGTNVNAVNNQSSGTMTLGNVTVDGLYCDAQATSNAGTALMAGGNTTLNGKLTVSNVYYKGNTHNTNGSGVVVKGSGTGSLTGTGSIEINGSVANEEYNGMYNGILATACPLDIDGDISVHTVKNQGIYVADGNACVNGNNITVKNVSSGQGIYVRSTSDSMIATGKITIEDVAAGYGLRGVGTVKAAEVSVKNVKLSGIEVGKSLEVTGDVSIDGVSDLSAQGLYLNTANSKATIGGDLYIKDAGGNGIYINDAAGQLAVTGTLTVINPIKGRAINTKGAVTAGNIVIKDVLNTQGTDYPAIYNQGGKAITVNGNLTIDNVVNAAGIRNANGTIKVLKGTTTITNISGAKCNGIQNDGGRTMNLKDVVIDGVTSETKGAGYGNGIINKGTITLSGTATISNVTKTATDKDNEACGIANVDNGKITGTAAKLVISNVKYGIYAGQDPTKTTTITGKVDVAEISITNSSAQGIYIRNGATVEADTVTINGAGKHGVQMQQGGCKFTVTTYNAMNIAGNALRLYNTSANSTTTIGTMNVDTCTALDDNSGYAVFAAAGVTNTNLKITTLNHKACTNGAYNTFVDAGCVTTLVDNN